MNNTVITALQEEAHRIEEDALTSSKGHFEAASRLNKVHLWLGIPTALLAGVAGVSAFKNQPEIAGSISMFVAALTAVSTFLNPGEKAQAHHLAGTKFNDLRTRARIFREIDLHGERDMKELTTSLKQLAAEKSDLNQSNPQIPRRPFQRARTGIESGEATYRVDEKSRRKGPKDL